ncbi:disease resistance protein RPV1 isoform X2 [Rosa chinensis]|uniref:disease resistance protein RPV1 isoform X2 n=1 Tax=Rosa chinensis TaxID=74649 RepID=UPI001AD8F205|nr:disease resistance protein RPV1 isoform X2 [Rosa chinensis]
MALMTTRNTSSSSSFPSLSSNPQWSEWTYDVFLSFRGEDTRKGFTDHLYVALEREGIFTFRDDEELERGKPISAKLLQAIQESRIAIVVFSRNYASSRWCLDELVKIVECMKEIGQTVLPVFYDVDPSEVRNQTEAFGKAFADHEKRFKNNLEKVERWRAALTEVANLSGFPLQNRYESEFIQGIVMKIRSDLDGTLSIFSKDLVGIGLRVEEMMELCLGIEEKDVGFIGIWGMGGIGKTTLARAFYEKVRNQFQASSYLNNVREVSTKSDGLVSLQEKLLFDVQMKSITSKGDVHIGISKIQRRLCHKKVLIILDDVDKLEQLQALAGSKNWFGRGSRIIITTRDEQLLIAHGVEKRYKARELKNDEALELFSWKAFKDNHPPKDYMEVSQDFVNYAKGLPLAIEVVGPFLSGKSIIEWKSSLSRLKGNLDKEIMRVLLMGFDGLHEKEQQIFLDIACFFKGEDRDRVTKILESFGFDPISSIGVLIHKSLITVIGRTLWMHDLLQGMGWEIVRQECTKEPGKRSRLWHYDDVLDVMQYDKGTDAVEGIVLNVSPEEKVQLNDEAFSMMKKLRFLKISNVILPHGLKYLSTELQYIEWHGYPSKLLPQNFPSSKLAELNMYCSQITHLWKGIKALPELPTSIKFVWAEGCTSLRSDSDQYEVWPSSEEGQLRIIKRSISPATFIQMFDLQFVSWLQRYHELEGRAPLKMAHGFSSASIIPEWFNIQSSSSSITVQLPAQIDDKSKPWIGYTMYVSFLIHESFDTSCGFKVKHEFDCYLHTNDGPLRKQTLYHELNAKNVPFTGSNGYWIIVPHLWFIERLNYLNECTSIEACTRTDSPAVEVKMSGARLLYEHDFFGFLQAIKTSCRVRITKIKKEISSEETKLTIKEREESVLLTERLECYEGRLDPGGKTYYIKGNLTDSQSATDFREILQQCSDQHFKYENWFPQREIPKWFCRVNGFSASFPLNPSLDYMKDWKGMAICAAFTVRRDPSRIHDNLDKEKFDRVECYLSRTGTSWGKRMRFDIPKSENPLLLKRRGFIWLSYTSRGTFPDFILNGCISMKATFHCTSQDIMVHNCGYQLVFHDNVEGFVETIMKCSNTSQSEPKAGKELNKSSPSTRVCFIFQSLFLIFFVVSVVLFCKHCLSLAKTK